MSEPAPGIAEHEIGVTSVRAPASPKLPVAPLVPILGAVSSGIVLDRLLVDGGHAVETTSWATFGILASAISIRKVRRQRPGTFSLLVLFFVLGAGWHHHRRGDLVLGDLAWSMTDAPRPVWIRGVIREALGLRQSGPESAGDDGANGAGPPGKVWSRFVIEIASIRDGDSWRPAVGRASMNVTGDRTDFSAGQAIEAAGSLAKFAGPLNPGEFDYRDELRQDGIWLRLSVKDPASLRVGDPRDDRSRFRWLGTIRDWSRSRLVATLDPEIAPLASALLLGQRAEIEDDINDAFILTGTTHLLAISGLHLQVLAVGLGALFTLAGMSRSWSAAAVILAVSGYAILVGLTPSVVRSASMTVAVCFAIIFFRRSSTMNNLALAALVILVLNPSDLFDVGCQLSFLAIITLVWLIPETRHFLEAGHQRIRDHFEGPPSPLDMLERKYAPKWKKVPRTIAFWLYQGLLTSIVVWFAALPLVMLRFHLLSPIGIALNIPLIAITSWAIWTSGMCLWLSAVWTPLGTPFGWLTSRLLRWTTWIVHEGAKLPWGHQFVAGPPRWWVCGFYAILGVALVSSVLVRERGSDTSRRWYAWRRLIWFSLFVWLLPGYPLAQISDRPARLEADLLAVGHGLAAVIQTPSGAAYLYDCGRMGDPRVGRRLIAPALWSRGIGRLNSVILSHADDDHYNGLPDLLDRFRIDEVCIPPGFGGAENPGAVHLIETVRGRGIPIRTVGAPDSWMVGDNRFRIWHPPADWSAEATDNARSVVLDVESSGRRLLLTGDLEQLGLVELVARSIEDTPIDVMLSPHHGGKTANPEWLYDWAKPLAILVSQRAPVPGSVDLLTKQEQGGIPIYRTWKDGALRLAWERSRITVRRTIEHPMESMSHASSSMAFGGLSLFAWAGLPEFGSNAWRWLAGIAGFLLGLLAVAIAAVVEFAAWTLLVPPQSPNRSSNSAEPTSSLPPGERIEVKGRDGARLSGRWYPATTEPGPIGTILLVHGFGETSEQFAAVRVPELNLARWNVAVLDSRGYGDSRGPFATFGAREADDLGIWLDSIRTRYGPSNSATSGPVALWGRSMGGAIAARGAATLPEISGLILESPLLDLHAALTAIFRAKRLPGASWLARLALRRAGRLAGVRIGQPKLSDVAPKVACPVLILQGSEDSLATLDTIQALARRFPHPAEVVEIPKAGHTDVIAVGGDALWERVVKFLQTGSETASR